MIPGILVLALAASVEFVRVAPSVRVVEDPHTGLRVTVQVDGFEISKTEITRQEYGGDRGSGASLPVANVTWFDAIKFANAFSKRKGIEPCYNPVTGARLKPKCAGYRLPTDAEWSRAFQKPVRPEDANLGLESVLEASPLLTLHARPPDLNGPGVRDMAGNVWEWCEDWFSPVRAPWPLHNPRGPLRGLARVIRGGSYQTTRSSWQGELRSSMDPEARSTRTGIRLVRSLEEVAEIPAIDWNYYQKPPAIAVAGPAILMAVSRDKWLDFIGDPGLPRQSPPRVRTLQTIQSSPWFDAQMQEFETEPGIWEKMLIVDGDPAVKTPRPVVIVPFYDVDTPAGLELGGRNFSNSPVIWFARHAAQNGYIAVAVRWFGESYGERYDEAVANLAARHPKVTGLGKWVWDSKRLIDYLETLPGVDRNRIGMIGHSLGGKMTMYAAAMDPRIQASVVSDPGVPLASTNYGDYWYLGEKLKALPAGSDHHELIGLIAPRSFLVIAGQTDSESTWGYLEATRGLYGSSSSKRLGWIHHGTGHRPPASSVSEALAWLWASLELPQ